MNEGDFQGPQGTSLKYSFYTCPYNVQGIYVKKNLTNKQTKEKKNKKTQTRQQHHKAETRFHF